jgi:PTH1 family peptidyl-tRNA hydrolase
LTKLIVGLGNPGREYALTRHNVGFMVVDALAERFGITWTREGDIAEIGHGNVRRQPVILLKPLTFMNRSGTAVAKVLRREHPHIEHTLLIHDDVDLDFGTIKMQIGGGDGGHKGIRSIMSELEGIPFQRLKIGVSRPVGMDVADYVLAEFPAAQHAAVKTMIDTLVLVVAMIQTEGISRAMNEYNRKSLIAAEERNT